MPKLEVASRIIMAPEHAKRLLMALQENIFKYEPILSGMPLAAVRRAAIMPLQVEREEPPAAEHRFEHAPQQPQGVHVEHDMPESRV